MSSFHWTVSNVWKWYMLLLTNPMNRAMQTNKITDSILRNKIWKMTFKGCHKDNRNPQMTEEQNYMLDGNIQTPRRRIYMSRNTEGRRFGR